MTKRTLLYFAGISLVISCLCLGFLFKSELVSTVEKAFQKQTGKLKYKFRKDPIDVVIPCSKKDLSTLDLCIESIKNNVKDLRRVIVVSAERYTQNAEWFDESVFPFNKYDIGYQIFNENAEGASWFISKCYRAGWIYQQLLKFYAPFVIPGISTNVLIVDSDAIFYQPVQFTDNFGAGLYNPGTENHSAYFSHMERLLPGLKRVYPEHSGISHHMLFQSSVLKDLFAQVESYHKLPFWQALCRCIDKNELFLSCLSEYEIYFNFVFSRTDQVKIRPLKWMNADDFSSSAREEHRNLNFDYVSYPVHTRIR